MEEQSKLTKQRRKKVEEWVGDFVVVEEAQAVVVVLVVEVGIVTDTMISMKEETITERVLIGATKVEDTGGMTMVVEIITTDMRGMVGIVVDLVEGMVVAVDMVVEVMVAVVMIGLMGGTSIEVVTEVIMVVIVVVGMAGMVMGDPTAEMVATTKYAAMPLRKQDHFARVPRF